MPSLFHLQASWYRAALSMWPQEGLPQGRGTVGHITGDTGGVGVIRDTAGIAVGGRSLRGVIGNRPRIGALALRHDGPLARGGRMPGILALPRLARLVELGPLEWPRPARTFIGLSLSVKLFLQPQLDRSAGNRDWTLRYPHESVSSIHLREECRVMAGDPLVEGDQGQVSNRGRPGSGLES